MALTFRDTKGSPLTSAEADANIRQLAGGGIDYANPVVVNAASTLLVNRSYRILGSGYPLDLPDPASNIGSRIFVRVALSTTGLFPLTGTPLSLYAGESAEVLATIDGWQRTSGELLPMRARIETSLNQQDSVGAGFYYQIPFSQVVVQPPAVPALVNIAGNALVVQRSGQAAIGATVALTNTTAGNAYFLLFQRLRNSAGTPIYQVLVPASNVVAQGGITYIDNFLVGDVLTVLLYNNDFQGAVRLRGQFAGSQCTLTFTEII